MYLAVCVLSHIRGHIDLCFLSHQPRDVNNKCRSLLHTISRLVTGVSYCFDCLHSNNLWWMYSYNISFCCAKWLWLLFCFASNAAPGVHSNALFASCMQCLGCCCGRCVWLARVLPWRLLLRPVPLLNAAWHQRVRHLLAGSGLTAALMAGVMRSAQWYFYIYLH